MVNQVYTHIRLAQQMHDKNQVFTRIRLAQQMHDKPGL